MFSPDLSVLRSFLARFGAFAAFCLFTCAMGTFFPCNAVAASKAAPAGETPQVAAPLPADPFPAVIQRAQKLAKRSFKPDDGQTQDYLTGLTESQWNGIQFNPDQALWADKDLPFSVEFYHPGFIYSREVRVHIVSPGKTADLPFNPDFFTYGSKTLADKVRQTPPGFAGFRITYPLNGEFSRDVVASFLGATYHRGEGRQSVKGVHSRAVALNTALPNGEEFPYFREYWIVEPSPGDTSLTVCALLDSPSMTGAYRFVITPGTSTVMDVEARLFLRKDAAWPQKVGIAPLNSMFLYSETDNGRPGDYRPEVHNSDGLLFSSEEGVWNWMPLSNPSRLTIATIPMENPRGFGLLQRDADFDHYQDMANRFDRKSSVWVEPQGEWGPGRIELVQIPSTEEIHDNIIVFWVPDSLIPVEGAENARTLSIAYKVYWMTPGVTPHALGRVTATRLVRNPETATFFIDFESEALKNLPGDIGLTSLVETPESIPITNKQLMKNPVTGGWRLSFTVKLPRQDSVVQSIISARDGAGRLRFRALLKKGENLPDPLTEEWVYDLPL